MLKWLYRGNVSIFVKLCCMSVHSNAQSLVSGAAYPAVNAGFKSARPCSVILHYMAEGHKFAVLRVYGGGTP